MYLYNIRKNGRKRFHVEPRIFTQKNNNKMNRRTVNLTNTELLTVWLLIVDEQKKLNRKQPTERVERAKLGIRLSQLEDVYQKISQAYAASENNNEQNEEE